MTALPAATPSLDPVLGALLARPESRDEGADRVRFRCPSCGRLEAVYAARTGTWRCWPDGGCNESGSATDLAVTSGVEPVALRPQTEVDAADAGPTPAPWGEPTPLPEGERPPFPTEQLPPPLRAFVDALAEATQTPAALPALMVLAAVAAASAKRVAVAVRPGWREPVNLYVVVALDSGNRKTAVERAASAPLRAFERERAKEAAPLIAQAESRRRIAEKALDRTERTAANADGDEGMAARSDANDLARQLATDPDLAVPRPPRLLADETTTERLAMLMAENGGRMAVLSAEGGIFDIMAGRFSKDGKTPALDLFLKGHSGDDLPIDRVGRQGDNLTAPALTLGVAVQTFVLRGLMTRPSFRGTGLLARNLFGLPESTVGRRRVNPPPVPEELVDAYAGAVTALLRLPGLAEEDGSPRPHDLTPNDAAGERFLRFERDLEPRLGPDGDLGHVADWGAKLAGMVARFAGIFHTVEQAARGRNPWDADIPERTVEAAIRVAEYFAIPHALTAFAEMGADPEIENARVVLRTVARWDEPTFSRRDLHQRSLKRRFANADDLDRPLAVLSEHGYLRPVPPDGGGDSGGAPPRRGRRPSDRYEINPLWRSQNPLCPQNSGSPRVSEDIADSANGSGENGGGDEERVEWIA